MQEIYLNKTHNFFFFLLLVFCRLVFLFVFFTCKISITDSALSLISAVYIYLIFIVDRVFVKSSRFYYSSLLIFTRQFNTTEPFELKTTTEKSTNIASCWDQIWEYEKERRKEKLVLFWLLSKRTDRKRGQKPQTF